LVDKVLVKGNADCFEEFIVKIFNLALNLIRAKLCFGMVSGQHLLTDMFQKYIKLLFAH